MITAARQAGGRLAERDALLIMMAYRHGLRASELSVLRWDQIDLKAGLIHVVRLKQGKDSTHPVRGPELRALRSTRIASMKTLRFSADPATESLYDHILTRLAA